MADIGRPAFTDTDYQNFLDNMAPFLKLGATIYAAIEDAGLTQHKDAIYIKYREKNWFSEKIDVLRAYPGKLTAYILSKELIRINERVAQGLPLTKDDLDTVRFMAEKHRTSQVYFVTRTETAQADPDKVGKILDTMESDYGQLAGEAQKQMVAVDAPIQDKG